jgi:hypothetical protein
MGWPLLSRGIFDGRQNCYEKGGHDSNAGNIIGPWDRMLLPALDVVSGGELPSSRR